MRDGEKQTQVWIASIHDKLENGVLSFDIHDILECLRSTLEDYCWVAFGLDCIGEASTDISATTTRDLIERTKTFAQTIDGKFLGYMDRVPASDTIMRDYSEFPLGGASIVIVAVDSSCFEVYTKTFEHIRMLRNRFSEVRIEDPGSYFGN